mmetsp:Transcript_14793/g.37613  ORF Transcript_14793/g.37613 Transcript_14793/m.37613 type:complete len:248 (-) Transcript_14793:749-1492(-)
MILVELPISLVGDRAIGAGEVTLRTTALTMFKRTLVFGSVRVLHKTMSVHIVEGQFALVDTLRSGEDATPAEHPVLQFAGIHNGASGITQLSASVGQVVLPLSLEAPAVVPGELATAALLAALKVAQVHLAVAGDLAHGVRQAVQPVAHVGLTGGEANVAKVAEETISPPARVHITAGTAHDPVAVHQAVLPLALVDVTVAQTVLEGAATEGRLQVLEVYVGVGVLAADLLLQRRTEEIHELLETVG